MWLQDKIDACSLHTLSELMKLVHSQSQTKVRHWHRISVHWTQNIKLLD